MNNIIVWNDLPLFYQMSNHTDSMVNELFHYLDCKCKCTYISYDDAVKWAEEICNDCITIGSRPGILLGNVYTITTVRKKSTGGYALDTYFDNDSVIVLRRYIVEHPDCIEICDDAVVEGNTLRTVIRMIRNITNTPIQIHILCAVENTIVQLMSEFNQVSIDARISISGKPIRDCTILFVSDLICDDPIFRMPFINNKKLMTPCFYEKYEHIRNALYSLARSEHLLPYYKLMNREALFVTDLDGTLIDNSLISESDHYGWKELIENGIPVTVATSRSEHGMRKCLMETVPLLPTIHYNGALIYDQHSGKILETFTFPPRTSSYILEHSMSIHAGVMCICLENGKDLAFAAYCDGDDATQNILSNMPDACERVPVSVLMNANNIIAIYEFTECTPLVGRHHVYTANGFNQYTPFEADKGRAAAWLAKKFGFGKIVAFGNAENDRSLYETADRFYARSCGDLRKNEIRITSPGDVLTEIRKECVMIYESL